MDMHKIYCGFQRVLRFSEMSRNFLNIIFLKTFLLQATRPLAASVWMELIPKQHQFGATTICGGEVERLLREYTQNQEMVRNIGSHYYQIIYPVQLRQHKKMGISTREIGSSKRGQGDGYSGPGRGPSRQRRYRDPGGGGTGRASAFKHKESEKQKPLKESCVISARKDGLPGFRAFTPTT
ncbi:hypothetical protein QE152_g965 [Popillia japonica]|uniref:Uncharacterized protein n=1 Tax=Popillia japonica TaxID=7064 RepID=A0AAW1N725_POPJA